MNQPSTGMKVIQVVMRYVIPLIIVLAAVSTFQRMRGGGPGGMGDGPPEHGGPGAHGPGGPGGPGAEEGTGMPKGLLVVVEPAHSSSHRIDIQAHGTVIPARSVILQPQVTGRITSLSEDLVPGGILHEGDEVLRVDSSDYRLRVSQARADVERAEAGLTLEEGRSDVAAQEWELFGDENRSSESGRSLALREPQMRDASVMVEAAEARLRQARLDLERTTLSAPFNALVKDENAEIGQLVGPASPLATLIGTDTFWIRLSLPYTRLSRIDIPGVNSADGSRVRIWQDGGDERIEREGRVVRLLYDLDPVGRMARIVVEVDDPLLLNPAVSGDSGDLVADDDSDDAAALDWAPPTEGANGEHSALPLLIGSFVQAEIEGRDVVTAVEIPRAWVQEGERVYVLTDENTLSIRNVEILWSRRDTFLIGDGLDDGDQVVTSPVAVPVEGMDLRTERAEVFEEQPERGHGRGTGPH